MACSYPACWCRPGRRSLVASAVRWTRQRSGNRRCRPRCRGALRCLGRLLPSLRTRGNCAITCLARGVLLTCASEAYCLFSISGRVDARRTIALLASVHVLWLSPLFGPPCQGFCAARLRGKLYGAAAILLKKPGFRDCLISMLFAVLFLCVMPDCLNRTLQHFHSPVMSD